MKPTKALAIGPDKAPLIPADNSLLSSPTKVSLNGRRRPNIAKFRPVKYQFFFRTNQLENIIPVSGATVARTLGAQPL